MAVVGAFFTSCSQNDELIVREAAQQNGEFTYNLHLNGGVSNFDGVTTRAVTTNWPSESVIYIRFLKSGTSSTYITGKAEYDGASWSFSTTSQLQTTSSNTSCTAVYVENPTSTDNSTINMSPTSVAYKGTGTYTCSSSDIYVNVTLSPVTARLRFKGNNDTKINLPSEKNDIKYISSISLTTLDITTAKTDASLTVKNGYTPYVYGTLTNANGNNNIYVTNVSESKNYLLSTFEGSKLTVGSSGYLTIPTNSNYNSLGWQQVGDIDRNAWVKPNFTVPFTDGICTNWSVGSTANNFYSRIFISLSDFDSDEEMIDYMTSRGTAKDAQTYANYISLFSNKSFYTPNTTYYLCTIAYNSDGVRGPLQKYEFKTNATNLPIASISNLSFDSKYWLYDVSMSNNATKYFAYVSEDSDDLDYDDRYLAFMIYYNIKKGKITDFYQSASLRTLRESEKCMVLTYALDSKSNIGNYDCVRYPTSSSNRAPQHNNNAPTLSNTSTESITYPLPSFKGTIMEISQQP